MNFEIILAVNNDELINYDGNTNYGCGATNTTCTTNNGCGCSRGETNSSFYE